MPSDCAWSSTWSSHGRGSSASMPRISCWSMSTNGCDEEGSISTCMFFGNSAAALTLTAGQLVHEIARTWAQPTRPGARRRLQCDASTMSAFLNPWHSSGAESERSFRGANDRIGPRALEPKHLRRKLRDSLGDQAGLNRLPPEPQWPDAPPSPHDSSRPGSPLPLAEPDLPCLLDPSASRRNPGTPANCRNHGHFSEEAGRA